MDIHIDAPEQAREGEHAHCNAPLTALQKRHCYM
jgi:hypothetical protein